MRRLVQIQLSYYFSVILYKIIDTVLNQIIDAILPLDLCQVFGLEYDLDLFNIVVVPDFNM